MESDTDDLLIGMDIIGQGRFLLSYDPSIEAPSHSRSPSCELSQIPANSSTGG